MYLVNAHQMRQMDRFTMDELGIPGNILMEHAGYAVAEEILKRGMFKKAVLLCGHGNNGGDGFVIARLLTNKGYHVEVFLLGDTQKLSSDSLLHYEILIKHGVDVSLVGKDFRRLKASLSDADLVVDAMLGTGAKGRLREPFISAVNLIEDTQRKKGSQRPYVVSVDIPTGIETDSGQCMGIAVQSDLTIALALPKWAHYLYPGANNRGELIVKDIGIPPQAIKHTGYDAEILSPSDIALFLPERVKHSHKGSYGHVLLIAGSHEMRGAPVLAGNAALRSGAGMVTIAVPGNIISSISSQVTEAIMWEWPEKNGSFSPTEWPDLQNRTHYSSVAIGPGIGVWQGGHEWLHQLLETYTCPIILDADGINLLAQNPKILKGRQGETILTPHPGEMGRLIGLTVEQVEKNRPEIAREFAEKYGVYLVLKGTYTLIATPTGKIYINPTGSPAMAKGGSGDVLTGVISAIIAQGTDVERSVLAGVYLHGITGEICGEKSEYSTVASDMIQHIGISISHILNNRHRKTHFPGN